jgi:hypothetical protein
VLYVRKQIGISAYMLCLFVRNKAMECVPYTHNHQRVGGGGGVEFENDQI